MARQLTKSWLDSYLEWTLPRSEAPESMIKWAGLFTLACVLKRKVVFPRTLLGSYEIYPSIYVVFVAEPGVARKSTTAGGAESLLHEVAKIKTDEPITFAPDVTSASKLMGSMADSPDGSIVVLSNEFSSIVQATPEQMYEILTALFDNKSSHRWETWAHGEKEITNPVVNLLAATTPAWISEQPSAHFLGGGFASRILFVHETKKRQSRLYYQDINQEEMKRLGAKLALDLSHIASLKGEFKHDSAKTLKYCEQWYQKHDKREVVDKRMSGYAARKHIHLHKVAMLLAVSKGDKLVITRELWDEALELLDDVEKKLPRALSSIGKNPLAPQMDAIVEFVEDRGEVKQDVIAARFYREVQGLDQLRSLLVYLVVAGKLSVNSSAENPVYKVKT